MSYININKKFISAILGLIITLLITSCASSGLITKTQNSLALKEMKGLKYYKREEFEKAFSLLQEPAAWGYKGAQYALAFMFLKGQHVEQSTLLGMGWLAVAKEANVKDWNNQYISIYSSGTELDKLKFDKIADVYISRYGLSAQHVTCGRSTSVTTRVFKIDCHKNEGVGVLYDVDLIE